MLNLKAGSCLLGAVFLFSSCVSEQSSLDLNTPLAVSNSNSLGTQTSADGDFVSPYPPGSPIPIKAPRQSVQTAAAASPANAQGTTQPVQAYQSASATQVDDAMAGQITQTGQNPTLVSSLAVPTQNPNKGSVQIANALTQPTDNTGVIEVSSEQAQPQTTQIAALNAEVSKPAAKSNFFTRWADSVNSQKSSNKVPSSKNKSYLRRSRSDDTSVGSNSSKKKYQRPQLASLSQSATSVSTNAALSQSDANKSSRRSSQELNALPGVKSNNEIFGIEEHGDEPATQVAALGGLARISPNGLRVQHDKVQVACLKQGVLQILKKVERRYGKKPIITSGYRNPKRNRRAGGARNSQHIYCKAVDIQVEGVSKWNLAKYLRSIPGRGGVGTYCRTKSVHIDIGKKRDWHSKCRRSSVKKRKTT